MDRGPTGDDEVPLRFGVLGELRVTLGDKVLDPGARLQRNLLAILLIEAGRVVAVDRLVELLWGDEAPSAALASLQAYVSQLRRILEPGRPARAPARVLVTQDPGYALKVRPDQVDAWAFQALAAEAHEMLDSGSTHEALERLESALGMWRGDPLAEFSAETWAVPIAARLTERRDAALEDRVDAWLALGRHAQAVAELEEMVDARPLRERRWGQLIVATYRCGRQADALRAYQRCRTVLGDELGIEPGPELRRLEAAVLAQDPALDRPPTAHAIPVKVHDTDIAGDPAADLHAVQVGRLRERISRAEGGRGGVVVLVGEPGVGKTTIAEQAADLAADAGAVVVWTRCLDATAAPAYWPWIQLLRDLPDGPYVASARQRLEGELELRGEGAAAAFHAYETVVAALRESAATRPVIACIDDLQAADDPSLALLQLLAGDLHRTPVLVIITMRDTEPSAALDRTLGELLRHRGVERLSVPPLQLSEVERLVTHTAGEPPASEVVTALAERTGGNLFYLTELLRLLGSEQRSHSLNAVEILRLDVPSGVRDVVIRRAQRLPDNTQALLTIAAVAGRDADLDLLERAAQMDSEQLMLALEPAVAAGLLAETDHGWGYRFRHPLIHESIYAQTGKIEQARLHARIGAALELTTAADTPARRAQLAHHFLAAGPLGDPAKALTYARAAAAAAARQGAWGEATRHLEAGLDVGAAAPDHVRCDVLIELGRARRSAGLIRESHDALQEAVGLADALGDEDRVLAAAVAFGSAALWGSREWGETDHALVAILQRQLSRLTDPEDERRVGICATLAVELYFGDDAPVGWEYANQALAVARQLGTPEPLGLAASAYLLSALVNDHIDARVTLIGELLDQQPTLGLPPDVEAVLRGHLLTERLRAGDMAAFDSELARVWDLATDVLHSVELQAQLHFIEACRYFITGDLDGGQAAGERGFNLLAGVSATWSQPSRIIMESSTMLLAGLTDAAGGPATLAGQADALAALADTPDHPSEPHLAAPAAALGYLHRGEPERARELVRKWFAPPPRAWTWMHPISYWAQVAIALGEPDPGWLYDQLLPHSGRLALVGVGADCGGAVDSLLAGLAMRLGRPQEALDRAQAGIALERHARAGAWARRTTEIIEQAHAALGS